VTERDTDSDGRRGQLSLIPLCLVLGLAVGLVVAGIRILVYDVMWGRLPTETALVAVFPVIGLLLSGLLLEYWTSRPDVHDTEAYIDAYHTGVVDRPRSALVKTFAAIATVGFGGAAGLEGPSMYIGSAMGGWMRPLLGRLGIHDGRAIRSLLIAGAAAGISAVFKAPLTGLIFALEVPYTDDFAREALVPALVASVSAYLALVSLVGAEPLFPVDRALAPSLRNVLLALVLGAVLGLVARLFSAALRAAEYTSRRVAVPLWIRTTGGGVVCGVLGLVTLRIYGSPLALSSGYEIINGTMAAKWIGVAALLLLVLRSGAVLATIGSGAAGGTFIPFMSMGAAAGAIFEGMAPNTGVLFPIVGMAAFLATANATPIAAAVFVAESTGSAGYIIPGLVAATVAYLVGGRKSVSVGQRPSRRA
jgi:chloride channel protein, CIC family